MTLSNFGALSNIAEPRLRSEPLKSTEVEFCKLPPLLGYAPRMRNDVCKG